VFPGAASPLAAAETAGATFKCHAIARGPVVHLTTVKCGATFRFIAPHYDELTYKPERGLPLIREGLRAFVGQTAFEELCRLWTAQRAESGLLFSGQNHASYPYEVGSHWSRHVQVDVVAINWHQRTILLGECKWGAEAVGRDVARELVEKKSPQVLRELPDAGAGWTVRHALFARAGLTDAACSFAEERGMIVADLAVLDRNLSANFQL
jgi:uncharacterized protein